MKVQQFELWPQCNNNCSYCYLGKRKYDNNPEYKLKMLNFALDWMQNYDNYEEYDNVSFIGGEFFQGQLDTPEVRAKWFEMLDVLYDLFDNDLIRASWWSATLAIGDQKDLYESLEKFQDVCNAKRQLWVVTSYDTIGRFHSKEHFETWGRNVKEVKKRFPWIFLNTCMIITDDLCKKVVSGELDLQKFREEYQTQLFLKPTYAIAGLYDHKQQHKMSIKQDMNKRIPGFYPTRENFLNMCKFLKEHQPDILGKMIEQKYRADNIFRESLEDHKLRNEFRSRDNSLQEGIDVNPDCGHSLAYKSYIDCENCIVCDKHAIEFGKDLDETK